jgi:hypothetical protein
VLSIEYIIAFGGLAFVYLPLGLVYEYVSQLKGLFLYIMNVCLLVVPPNERFASVESYSLFYYPIRQFWHSTITSFSLSTQGIPVTRMITFPPSYPDYVNSLASCKAIIYPIPVGIERISSSSRRSRVWRPDVYA